MLLLSATALFSFRNSAEDGIRISITRLENQKGHVLVSLFKDGVGFPDKADKAFRRAELDINGGKASVFFSGLPKGNYAVAILHDENNDHRMNSNSLGIPKEGYGFSNNVVGAFGPPSWNRAMFSHNAGSLTEKEIRARY